MDEVMVTPPTGKLPCKAVGIIVINEKGEILLLDRRKGTPGWACPAGHVEPGEHELVTAKRELFEETGVQANDSMKLVLWADINNPCNRGAKAHEWWIYTMVVDHDLAELKEPKSHKGIGWFELAEAEALEIEPIWRLVLNMAFI
ncbi:MAG: NUDIX hydrolase [bacterium]|nr:NUDIX hydrolase [bacterium]